MNGNFYQALDNNRRDHLESEIKERLGIQEDLSLFYVSVEKIKKLEIVRLIDSQDLETASCGYFLAGGKDVRGDYDKRNVARDKKRDIARGLLRTEVKELGGDKHVVVDEMYLFDRENYKHQGSTAFHWKNGISNGHSLHFDFYSGNQKRIVEETDDGVIKEKIDIPFFRKYLPKPGEEQDED